jgi:plastocyanin
MEKDGIQRSWRSYCLRCAAILVLVVPSGTPGGAMLSPSAITLDGRAPYYEPAVAIVEQGVSIHWINPTASVHSIRHDACVGRGACAFDSGPLNPDGIYVLSGLPPGQYGYHCALHPVMRGSLIVLNTEVPPGFRLTEPAPIGAFK